METLLHSQETFSLTHDVQDVVSYLSGSDSALLGVSLQNLQHGLQLVQSAVLTLLTDEPATHRLGNTHRTDRLFAFLTVSFISSFIPCFFQLPFFLSVRLFLLSLLAFPPLLPVILLTVHCARAADVCWMSLTVVRSRAVRALVMLLRTL